MYSTRTNEEKIAMILAAQNHGLDSIINNARSLGEIVSNWYSGICESGYSESQAEKIIAKEQKAFLSWASNPNKNSIVSEAVASAIETLTILGEIK